MPEQPALRRLPLAVRAALSLYPVWWRERYGADAQSAVADLLDDGRSPIRMSVDCFVGAGRACLRGPQGLGGAREPRWTAHASAPLTSKSVSTLTTVSACSSFLLALSSALPWYGLAIPDNRPWPWNFQFAYSAASSWLSSGLAPGQQGMGMAVVIVAVIIAAFAVGVRISFRRAPALDIRSPTLLLAGLATTVCVLCFLEASARPPLGDGPPLSLDYGGVFGMLAAVACAASSWCAVAVINRMAKRSASTPARLTGDLA